MEFSRTLIKHQMGDVAIDDAWKVERIDGLSFVIRPGEAWYDGLPYFLRSSADALVNTTFPDLGTGIVPNGTTITDLQPADQGYPGKKITLPGTTTADTYRVVIEAKEQVITNQEDGFIKSANLNEATAQKLRLYYTINIVEESLQGESLIPYKGDDSTDKNLVNEVKINVGASGSQGSVVSINPIAGSEQIDGRDLEVVVINDSSVSQNPLPKTTSERAAYDGGRLIDNVGNEFHIVFIQNDPNNTVGQDIIKLDKEVDQADPILALNSSYRLVKRDVYTTGSVSGDPLGKRFFPIAKFLWKLTSGITHESDIVDMRSVIEKTSASQNTANTKFDLTLAGGGLTTAEPSNKASGTITILDFSLMSSDTIEINGVSFVEGADFSASLSNDDTANALAQAINSSTDILIDGLVEALVSGSTVTVIAVSVGELANSYTMSYIDGGTVGAVLSGGTLTGGTDLTEGKLVWEEDYQVINPHSAFRSTILADEAVMQDGGAIAVFLDYDATSDTTVSKGSLALTTTTSGIAGTTITLSGSPDLTDIKLGNTILTTSSNATAAITAVDNVAKTITLDGDLLASGASIVYLDTFAPGTLPLGPSTYVVATSVDNIAYINNATILKSGENNESSAQAPVDITALSKQINQDRTSKLIEGGVWSWDLVNTTLAWSADASVSVAGLADTVNLISAGSTAGLDADGKVLYVTLNRTAPGGNLSISSADIASVPLTDNVFIIARRVGDEVLVGKSFLLKDRELLELDGALAEINRMLGQLKLSRSIDTDKVLVSGVDVGLLDGETLSQQSSNLIVDYLGDIVDFTLGTGATGLGGITTDIPLDGEYLWYGLSLDENIIEADNRISGTLIATPAATPNVVQANAPYPVVPGDKKIGAVLVQRVGTSAVVVTLRKFLLAGNKVAQSSAQSGTFQESYDLDIDNTPVKITTDAGQGDIDIKGTEGLVVSADKGVNVTGGVTQTNSITTTTTSNTVTVAEIPGELTQNYPFYAASVSVPQRARHGQSFIPTVTGNIKTVKVFLQQAESTTYRVQLFEEGVTNTSSSTTIRSGMPEKDDLLATSDILTEGGSTESSFPNHKEITFTFTGVNEVQLVKGTKYYLVFEELVSVTAASNLLGSFVTPYYEDGYMLDELTPTPTADDWSWFASRSKIYFSVDVTNSSESSNIKVHGASSGTVEIQAQKVTTNYRIILPEAQGPAGYSLTNDGTGTLNWESNLPKQTHVDLLNNQPFPVSVDGFEMDSTVDRGFSADVLLSRTTAATPTIDTAWQTNVNGFNVPAGSIIAMQPDGKALVGLPALDTITPNRNLIRINVDGTDDTAFRNNTEQYNGNAGPGTGTINAITVESDGNILVGGDFYYQVVSDISEDILRLSPSGVHDSNFSNKPGKWNYGSGTISNSVIEDIIVLPNNDIIMVGGIASSTSTPEDWTNRFAALHKISPSGETDVDFERNFWAIEQDLNNTGSLDGVALLTGQAAGLLPNGDIVVTGKPDFFSTDIVIRKYDKYGRRQHLFESNVSTNNITGINNIIGQKDNSIIITGSLTTFNGTPIGRIIKLDKDGVEDVQYTTTVGTAFDNTVNGVVRQADGKLIVVGAFQDFNGTAVEGIVRLNLDGTLDSTFPTHTFGLGPLTSAAIVTSGHVLVNGTFTTVDGETATNLTLLVSDVSINKQFNLRGFFDDTTQQWNLGESTFIGETTGVDLTMTAEGQLQYTSTNLPGTQINNFIRFLIRKL